MLETRISCDAAPGTALLQHPLDTEEARESMRASLADRLSHANPKLYALFANSTSVNSARQDLYAYLLQREKELEWGDCQLHCLDHDLAQRCVRVCKSLFSPQNETRVGFSTLRHLWRFVKGIGQAGSSVSEGFILEFVHLFAGIRGQTGMAQGWLGPALAQDGIEAVDAQLKGRVAGAARSDFLDRVSERMWELVERHPVGIDPGLVAKRQRNRMRILDFFDAAPHYWENYAWQLAHIFKGPEALPWLEELIPITDTEREAIRLCVEHGIPFGITPYYLSLFDFDSATREEDAQIRSQVIPPIHYVECMIEHSQDRDTYFDFMGEHDTSPIDLVTRRYATIAILKAYDTCPQICVYCQRNWEITGPMEAGALPNKSKLDAALDWFARHPGLRDVLITGGDPFFLSDARIEYMLERLAAIDHIVHIRWGTRAPVTMPMRITAKLAELLGRYLEPGRRTLGVVTHIESAAEVTPELAQAVDRLRRQGIYVYNQQVFTLHTSRRFQTVANRIAMKRVGVDPYYTFYPKGKEETSGYATPLARILQERKEEARLLPGSFRTDEPVFNVPRLGKNHLRAAQDRELVAIRPDGRRVYLWHPWEKGITPVNPWLYVDSSIHEYLRQIEHLGEDPAEYASIWHYY